MARTAKAKAPASDPATPKDLEDETPEADTQIYHPDPDPETPDAETPEDEKDASTASDTPPGVGTNPEELTTEHPGGAELTVGVVSEVTTEDDEDDAFLADCTLCAQTFRGPKDEVTDQLHAHYQAAHVYYDGVGV